MSRTLLGALLAGVAGGLLSLAPARAGPSHELKLPTPVFRLEISPTVRLEPVPTPPISPDLVGPRSQSAGFTVVGAADGLVQPMLEVCGPEVTFSLHFGGLPRRWEGL